MKLQVKPFSNAELSAFCEQMTMILKAGISPLEGISTMLEDAVSKEEQEILAAIRDNYIECCNFSKALDMTAVFPQYMIKMLSIGEASGRMDNVMESLSNHYAREEAIQKSIRNTVLYPLVMTGMMIVVIVILLVKVMPIFNQVFQQLGTEMTGLSRALMDIGNGLSTYSAVFVGILAVLIVLAVLAVKTDKGRSTAMKFLSHFKSIREIYDNTNSCRFAGGMALTLASGLNPSKCLELVEFVSSDKVFSAKIRAVRAAVDEGRDLADALHQRNIFSGVYARMCNIGQKTGHMENAMEKIAEQYEIEIDTRMNNFLSVIEPAIVVVLSVIIGVILLSVMIPLLGIMSGL